MSDQEPLIDVDLGASATDQASGSPGHQPVERLWDDARFRARIKEMAKLRGFTVRDVLIGAGTSMKYMDPSSGRNTNIIMRVSKFLDCHPAYLMFGPTVATQPESSQSPAPTSTNGLSYAQLAAGGGSIEQRLAVIAQIIASHWLHVSLDPKAACMAAAISLRQIALLTR